jgi:hypothetical protein
MWLILGITITMFAAAMAMMGIGVILRGRCFTGTCGNEENEDDCDTCPNKERGECPTENARLEKEAAELAAR